MTTEVPYIGHVLIETRSRKVHAFEGMPSPADKPALLRFLGMVNYMSKLIPNLADLTQPLRELLLSKKWNGIGPKDKRKHSKPLKKS